MNLDPGILIAHYERTVAQLTTENVKLSVGVEQLQHEVLFLQAELRSAQIRVDGAAVRESAPAE
ncbi:hypothetical protein [Catellatospora sp. TT07R-123]|uniref:hypothetical protein n=1 Tax=Catellatospora sp. TT07R-123 TaxID=2733863 RepID=UPI001BB3B7B9|nr:hypothetical protein [Catellatospora sp. TT07R-123]